MGWLAGILGRKAPAAPRAISIRAWMREIRPPCTTMSFSSARPIVRFSLPSPTTYSLPW